MSDLLTFEMICSYCAVICFILSISINNLFLVFVIFGYLFLTLQIISVFKLLGEKR